MTMVMPQPSLPLKPATTAGTPAMVTPAAWNFGERSCTKFQYDGIDSGRWVSLAISGLPLRVRLPEIAQLLDAATPSIFSSATCEAARSSTARPGICPLSCKPSSFAASPHGSGSPGYDGDNQASL